MIPDYVSLAYQVTLTPPQGRLTGVKLGQEILFSQFALRIKWYVQGYRLSADVFTHYTGKIFGDHLVTVL